MMEDDPKSSCCGEKHGCVSEERNEDKPDGEELSPVNSGLPELPVVPLNCIPLSIILSRVIAASASQILGIIEVLREQTSEEQKLTVTNYVLKNRERYAKLLALSRFSKYTKEQRRIAGVHVLLDEHNSLLFENPESYVRSCPFMLHEAFEKLSSLRFAASHDIDSALEILSTGRLRTLPESLKAFFPRPVINDEEEIVILSLESAIKRRLFHEIIPNKIKDSLFIEKGQLVINLKGVYKVSINILDRSLKSPWKVLDVALCIKFPKTEISGLYRNKFNNRLEYIKDKLQIILDQVANRNRNPEPFFLHKEGKKDDTRLENRNDLFYVKNLLVSDLISKSLNINKQNYSISSKFQDSSVGENAYLEDNNDCEMVIGDHEAPVSFSPYSLCYIHYYLTHVFHVLRIKILMAQASYFSKTRWNGFINVNNTPSNTLLEIDYWFREIMTDKPDRTKIVHCNTLKIELTNSHSSLPSIFEDWTESKSFNDIYSCFLSHSNQDNNTLNMGKKELSYLIAQKILNYDGFSEENLMVSICVSIQNKHKGICKEVKQHPLLNEETLTFPCDVNLLDVETLLIHFITREKISFYEKLKKAAFLCGMKSEYVSLDLQSSGKFLQTTDDQGEQCYSQQFLRLTWLNDACIDVLLNMLTGKINIRDTRFNSSLKKEYKHIEEILNLLFWSDTNSIRDALYEFQNMLVHNKIVKMAYFSNMKHYKQFPFDRRDVNDIIGNIPSIFVFLHSSFSEGFWLLVTAARKETWRTSLKCSFSQNADNEQTPSFSLLEDNSKFLYRLWSIKEKGPAGSLFGTGRMIETVFFVTTDYIHEYNVSNYCTSTESMQYMDQNDLPDSKLYWSDFCLSKLFYFDMIGGYILLYTQIINELKYLGLYALYARNDDEILANLRPIQDVSPLELTKLNAKIIINLNSCLLKSFGLDTKLSVRRFSSDTPFSDIIISIMPGSIEARTAGLGVIPNHKFIAGKKSTASSVLVVCRTRLLNDYGLHDVNIDFGNSKKFNYNSNFKLLSMFFFKGDVDNGGYIKFIIVNIRQIWLMLDLVTNYNQHRSNYFMANLVQENFNLFRLSFIYKNIRLIIRISKEMRAYILKNYNSQFENLEIPIYRVKFECLYERSNKTSENVIEKLFSVFSNSFEQTLNHTRSIFSSITATSLALDVLSSLIQNWKRQHESLDPYLGLSMLSRNILLIRLSDKLPLMLLRRVNGMNLMLLNFSNTSDQNAGKLENPGVNDSSYVMDPNSIAEAYKTLISLFKKDHPDKEMCLMSCNQGLILNTNILDNFMDTIVKYSMCLQILLWLAKKFLAHEKLQLVDNTTSSITVNSEYRKLTIFIDSSGNWSINFSKNKTETSNDDNLSDKDLIEFNQFLSQEVNSTPLEQLKNFMCFVEELLNAHSVPFRDIFKTSTFNDNHPNEAGILSTKLLICAPPGSELRVPRSTIDTGKNLVTAIFKIGSNVELRSTVILIKYNYITGVIAKAAEHEHGSDDITAIEKMDSMMVQKLQFDTNSNDLISSLSAKVSVSSPISEEDGPGRLFSFVKKLSQLNCSLSDLIK